MSLRPAAQLGRSAREFPWSQHAALASRYIRFYHSATPLRRYHSGVKLSARASGRPPLENASMAGKSVNSRKRRTVDDNSEMPRKVGAQSPILSPAVQDEPAPMDPESDEDVPLEADELQTALSRPPPVNSGYLPLPWKGRLGYVSVIDIYTVLDSSISLA